MTYQIRISREAAKTFRRIHPKDAAKLKVAIESLAIDPRPSGCLRLAGGDGEYRIRVVDYRVIYEIRDGDLVVLVLRLGHRREVYR